MIDNALVKKIRALIAIRVIFVTLLLGSFFLFNVEYKSFPHPRATLNLIIVLYSLTIIYSILLGLLKQYTVFAYVQFFIDALAANLLIYITGGIESWFSFIMPLTVMSASTVLNKKAGYVIATFNSIMFGTIIDLQYYKILPVEYDPSITEKVFLYNIFVHISAFYLVAFLSGYLSSRLERTAEALEQTGSDLRELALFNEELIENIPSGVFTTDMNGRILIFNRAAEDITGILHRAAIGMEIKNVFAFIGDQADTRRVEGTIRHPGKGDRTISLTMSSLVDTSASKIGFIGIFQDITLIKNMEKEIKQKEKLAAIGELSANIAHEIRNPLASLKGSVEILKENKVSQEQKERLTEIALKEMERLNKIITDFLTYSNPRAVELGIFDLRLALDETLELLKNTALTKKDTVIRKNFEGPLMIKADQQKLRQVFWNLGMNAMEAMPGGGELSVSAERENDHIIIIFMDTGTGITETNMEKIFYPFFTTKDEGTGLGLAIAYRIIEEHKGKISVAGNHNSGTVFKVIIPVEAEDRRGINGKT